MMVELNHFLLKLLVHVDSSVVPDNVVTGSITDHESIIYDLDDYC